MAKGQLEEAPGRQHEWLLPTAGVSHADVVEVGLQTLAGVVVEGMKVSACWRRYWQT